MLTATHLTRALVRGGRGGSSASFRCVHCPPRTVFGVDGIVWGIIGKSCKCGRSGCCGWVLVIRPSLCIAAGFCCGRGADWGGGIGGWRLPWSGSFLCDNLTVRPFTRLAVPPRSALAPCCT